MSRDATAGSEQHRGNLERRTPLACAHCSLPVPTGSIDAEAELQFCCAGCRTVYDVIRSCGLERFYQLQTAEGTEPVAARTTGRAYAELDDESFRAEHTAPVDDRLRSAELYLDGVHCAACVWLVEKLPRVAPGVVEARLDLRKALVRVVWDEGRIQLSRVARALDSLGYPPHPARDSRIREARTREDRQFLIRLAVAGAGAGNVMVIAFALYGGAFTGMEREYGRLFRWTSMAIGLVTILWPGSVFFRGAWAAIRTRTPHMDLPIALGLCVGLATGTANTLLDRGEIYFDSLTVLVFLLLVGRWIQHRQQRWAASAIELLYALTPSFARVLENGQAHEVPVEALRPGQRCEVLAGESFPADGTVDDGSSSVDLALLTGESAPIAVAAGSRVYAGAVNLSGRLRISVAAAGEATRAGRLMALVEEYSRRKAPLVQRADLLAGWFVVGVLLLATITFLAWVGSGLERAVDNTIALLIVTCPCALGLATPLAVAVSIGRAARNGILLKGGNALEQLARPTRIFLDKTGTLTEGRPDVIAWHGDEAVRPIVASLEALSSHPIARALARDSEPAMPATRVFQTTGAGIDGEVGSRRVAAGSRAFVTEPVGNVPAWAAEAHRALAGRALTPVWIAVDGEICAVVGIGDRIRHDAAAAIEQLRTLGWKIGVLSGDDHAVVAAVAAQLGLPAADCSGGMSPEEKVRAVESARDCGPVVMVGDGVNDAAALSAATVGIAVHGGAEASLAAADVYLSRAGLDPLIDLLGAARSTVRMIHGCLGVSLLYNAVAATLAMLGVIGPLVAAVLMPLSSFTVLAIALGSGRSLR